MKKIIIALLLNTYLNASYWQGTIGKSKIYLNLNCDVTKKTEDKNSCRHSRYFYESQLQDIVIGKGGKINEHQIRLQVEHSEKIEEEFLLDYFDGKLIGSWKSKGKVLNVALKKLELNDKYNTFDIFRKKFLKFKRAKVEKLRGSNKELVWIEELHSKSMFFRLGNGFSKVSRTKLNPIFDALQNEFSTGTLSCSSAWNYGTGMEVIRGKYVDVSKDLIGINIFLNYFCGAPYPDFNTRRHLYDVHSGKKYELKDIVTIANKPSKIRELGFKAEGMELKAQTSLEHNGYDPYNLEHWEYMGWSYEEEGIRFFLKFRTAERCYRGDSYLIPFKLLKPYKKKSFPYEFKNYKK